MGINFSMELIRGNRLPEERLFQAVLLQAKQDSYDWFTNDTELFNDICWSGNFDPEIVRQKFNELISNKTIKYTKVQLKWLRYRWLYKEYRSCTDKGQRRKILKEIKSIEGLKRGEKTKSLI